MNARLLAATNRDLERLVQTGRFRDDLYFRLKVIEIDLPPLRERPEEIADLVEHFVAQHNERWGTRRRFGDQAIAALRNYAWPGNIRELRHAIERVLVLADAEVIGATDLPNEIRAAPLAGRPPSAPIEGPPTLVALERDAIVRALSAATGHRARAAAILGISERTLYRKLRGYGLDEDPDAGSGSET